MRFNRKTKQIKIAFLNSVDILDDYDHILNNQYRLYSCECYSEKASVMILRFEDFEKVLAKFEDNYELFKALALNKLERYNERSSLVDQQV